MPALSARSGLRWKILAAIPVVAFGITLALPQIPQPAWYHNFADTRTLLGVPNAIDVLSNLPFIIVGLIGINLTLRNRSQSSPQRWALLVLFVGLFLTGFGSGYYHLAPDNQRLLWDRLPMTIAMSGFLTLLLVDRMQSTPRWVLPLLLILGLGSALGWAWSEARGQGDLRWYSLYQALVIIGSVALLAMFPALPARAEPTRALVMAILGNVAAKVFELLDKPIFAVGGLISGHTLKHLAAGLGFIPLLIWLAAQNRETAGDAGTRDRLLEKSL
jgi:hypothetical protein